jgi:hypothetical protein
VLLSSSACQRQLAGGAFSLLHNHFIALGAVDGCNSSGDTDSLRLIVPEEKREQCRYGLVHFGKIVGMSGR